MGERVRAGIRSLGARLPAGVLRSAIRFALAILVADLIILRIFSDGSAVALGSFAVIVLLYFL
ncbi:MAG: hypothetical protein ACKOW5_11455, partial [Actinomycetales bacterium]